MHQRVIKAVAACAVGLAATSASAATLGAVENFQSGLNGWGSIPSMVTHQPAGGADGPSDGFAKVEVAGTQLLIRATNTTAPTFTGDYLAAGITQISFALNELDTDDNLSIRFGFGFQGNFWVSNQIFDPQANTWETFTLDLIESNFTHVAPGGTFETALSSVTRIQIRLDSDSPSPRPDFGTGDFGVDNIALLPSPGPIGVFALGGMVAMVRRRRI